MIGFQEMIGFHMLVRYCFVVRMGSMVYCGWSYIVLVLKRTVLVVYMSLLMASPALNLDIRVLMTLPPIQKLEVCGH